MIFVSSIDGEEYRVPDTSIEAYGEQYKELLASYGLSTAHHMMSDMVHEYWPEIASQLMCYLNDAVAS